MFRLPKLNRIQPLVKRRFPNYFLYLNGPPDGCLGQLSEVESASLRQEIERYVAELREKSDDEIAALYEQELATQQAEKEQELQLEEERRFFNQPAADADLMHWSKMPLWRLEEATTLLFGKDPAKVSWKHLESLTDRSDFAKKYERARQLVNRAETARQLTDPMSPTLFLGWARSLDLTIPESLIELVEKHSGPVASWKDRCDHLKRENSRLEEELKRLNSSQKSGQVLINNQVWATFQALATKAISQYPGWRNAQSKVQKTGNLQEWLTSTIGANNREAELLKKVLSDEFEELM